MKSRNPSLTMRFADGGKTSGAQYDDLLSGIISQFVNAEGDYMTRAKAICDPGVDVDLFAGDLALALQRSSRPDLSEIGARALKELADRGHNRARFNMAILCLRGEFAPSIACDPICLLTQVAQTECADRFLKGHALAYLGVCYREGQAVERDTQKAVDLFEQAALVGVADAAFEAGLAYDDKEVGGYGVVDFQKAAELYFVGVQLGHARCMTHLAVLYLVFRVAPPYPQAAMDLLTRAAESGDGVAKKMKAQLLSPGVPRARMH